MTPQEAFAMQAVACRSLGSEFMGQLMSLVSERLTVETEPGRLALKWQGDPRPSADSVPLRLAGALHWLALSGTAPELAAVYPPNSVDDDSLWAAVSHALDAHGAVMVALMASPPQTNEIRRAAALVPMLHAVAGSTGLPVMLSELGASAGLNLRADQFRIDMGDKTYGPENSGVHHRPDTEGKAPDPVALNVVDRAGVDLRPFDLTDANQTMRLLSYLWPDQPHRMDNTRAAVAIADQIPAPVAQADAIDWLATRLETQSTGVVHVVYHTIAWQYFPADVQAKGEALLAAAGAAATASRPLARISMEADGHGPGAAMTLTQWPGGAPRAMGRVDFHGRWIKWEGAGQ